MRLRPMFPFFGSKWRLGPKYPAPKHATIVEPFAGSASYSLCYPDRNVWLYDKDPIIVGVWDYLIKATPAEIRALPWDFDHVDDLNIPQEARWLIGFWLNSASVSPRKTYSKWARQYPDKSFWCNPRMRERVADQVQYIKHWRVSELDYRDTLTRDATWFVDPPYQVMGKHYRMNKLDYADLSRWCRTPRGQVIVCENDGADWLPFEPFNTTTGTHRHKITKEVIWVAG